jgi:two-component system chemotaxis sensor kinase CheA
MGLSEQIRQQLINSFKTEQREHVQKINDGLLALEKNPDGLADEAKQALLHEIFREAHSLKGAARAVGMTTIESLGHALEDLLLGAKDGRLAFSTELFDLLYQTLDAVELVMKQLDRGDTTPPTEVLALLARLEEARQSMATASKPAAHQEPSPNPRSDSAQDLQRQKETIATNKKEKVARRESSAAALESGSSSSSGQPPAAFPQGDETIRVSVSKLDALMDQFSELLGAKIRAEQRLVEVRELQAFAAEWHTEWQPLRNHYNRLVRSGYNGRANLQTGNDDYRKDVTALVNFAAKNQDYLRAFNTQCNSLYRKLSNDTMRLSLIIDELQEEIKRVRMLPLTTITATYGRMVRDLAREQAKQIDLTIRGGETELDKRVLEQIKDPLIHLLRNAVDHGIETAAERKAAGKPATGQIILSASQQGNNVVITTRDDGQGLDLAAVRRSAVRRGWLALAEAEKLSDNEAVNLIFNSGLSTSQIITDISGRGVGLDVVRQNVEDLHGTLEVTFEPGQGTTFTMTLPLTLASSRGLLVGVGGQTFALPHSTVERMLHIKRSQIATVEGKEAISYQGKPVTLAWLADLLELAANSREADTLTVVIVGVAEKRLGLVVDSLTGEQEIVMKSMGKQLARVGGIAGATVLGSGQVILVLHTADLVKLATRPQARRPGATTKRQEAPQRKTILVVDDSITTRTLEKNILEAAGYKVKLATDGEQALGLLLAEGLPHLVVSDINMPRLDGFELTSRIKQDNRYGDIPVILVTSLDSPADKARGIEVGADAYIVKSSFDQGNLLKTIEQLV